jgi:molecular chaperone GrpE (heat shock protein)
MTEKQTQPSAIAQAAAKETCIRSTVCSRWSELLRRSRPQSSSPSIAATMIDKHIAPLREEIENLEQEGCEIQKAYAKAEAEIERLTKQLEGK